MTERELPWQRLEPRMLVISTTWLVPPLVSTLLTLLLTGGELDLAAGLTLASIGVTFLIIAAAFAVRLRTTRYRVTGERVELRVGLVFRRYRAVPRDRIRSVDLTATPVHRILGLRQVRVSAGAQSDGDSRQLVLDGISLRRAEELRQLAQAGTADERTIAALRWSWFGYAPLSVWGVAGVGVAVGGFFRLLDSLKINPAEVGLLRSAWFALAALPLWAAILLPVAIVLLLGAITSMTTFVETWWGYRLERAEGGALRLHRGLFNTRQLWIERRRLRGVQVAEPQPLRWAGGARLNAIAVGLGNSDDRPSSLKSAMLPPAPAATTRRVAEEVLGEPAGFLDGIALRPAPRVALRRRLSWAAYLIVVVELPLIVLGVLVTGALLHVAWISALVLVPVAFGAAVDAYRSLGSGLHGDYLVTRYGTWSRRTVLLDRAGILGWSINQTPAQRRAGIATFVALIAAGRGGFKVRDIALADGLALAREATGGILDEFVGA